MSTVRTARPLIGETPEMQELNRLISVVAQNHSTVLVRGESGTGKELVAREIHRRGVRANGPFMAVNCAGISRNLLESELFGHVKGAFTGALYDTLGFFRSAEGGTIFLDEVLEMDIDLQSKLLRVLQEREIRPVGSSQTFEVNVRVIAATNRDVEQAMAGGHLRGDLYYRLNVVGIELPPLRRRKGDIPGLVKHFLDKYAAEYGMPEKTLHPGTNYVFLRYDWPGNVRELENVIERAYAINPELVILPEHLPVQMTACESAAAGRPAGPRVTTLEEAERAAILQALAAADGNQSKAADFLGIHRNRLARKIRRFRI